MTEEIEELPPSYLYKVESIVVPEEDPWKNDLLGRKNQALKLQRILDPIKQPFVMTLTAPYGMGKSTFFRCWAQDLKNQKIHSVTFNAWETDYSNDAFSAFVSSIIKQLPESEVKDRVKNKALKVGAAILRKTPALLAKAATKHLIGDEAAKDLKALSLSEDDLAGLTESVAEEMFDRQEQIQNAVADFKVTLEEIIVEKLNGQLYIFVDELDRCRPTYAVEVLERIKHVFSVKGAKFVIAIDPNQLQNAIKGVYGADIDASGYVRKFIDWNHDLYEPKREQYVNYLCNDLFKIKTKEFFRANLKDKFDSNEFGRKLNLLVDAYELSLRDIDQYFTYLKLIAGNYDLNRCAELEVYLAAFFKWYFPSEYKSIIYWKGDAFFNQTTFDEPVRKLFDKFSERMGHGEQFDKAEVGYQIATLVAMMSRQAVWDTETPKVCVSSDTYNIVLKFHSELTTDWLKKLLITDRFDEFPNVQKGLMALERLAP